MTIPKLAGPPLYPLLKPACFLEQEDGTFRFTLENESGWLLLETCPPPTIGFLLELETETGTIALESGGGSIELEAGP